VLNGLGIDITQQSEGDVQQLLLNKLAQLLELSGISVTTFLIQQIRKRTCFISGMIMPPSPCTSSHSLYSVLPMELVSLIFNHLEGVEDVVSCKLVRFLPCYGWLLKCGGRFAKGGRGLWMRKDFGNSSLCFAGD